MADLERKQVNDVAVYGKSINTDNPNVKRRQGAKTIVAAGSDQDNQLNQVDASVPTNTRYTFLMKNAPKGDDNGGS